MRSSLFSPGAIEYTLTSVEVNVNSIVSIGASYTINYQNKPPNPGIRRTDTTVLTTLIVDF